MNLTLYTDGSIIGNPGGDGGWSAILVSGNAHRIRSGTEYDTTNNRMEMQAAIEGLRGLGRQCRHLTVVSDSEYLVKGFTEGRLEKMAANAFRKKGKLVKNHDLWEALNELDLRHDITWTHHAGEHRKAERLGGAERYMALAHSFALAEARIAHWVKEETSRVTRGSDTRAGKASPLSEGENETALLLKDTESPSLSSRKPLQNKGASAPSAGEIQNQTGEAKSSTSITTTQTGGSGASFAGPATPDSEVSGTTPTFSDEQFHILKERLRGMDRDGHRGTPEWHALHRWCLRLSEARIAHICREIRLEEVRVPETLQARESLVELLGELPDPPDPPPFEGKTTYAVYQRVGSPGRLLFRGPLFIPMMPESYTDEDGIKDGGRWECQKAATTMSRTDATKEGVRYRDWRIPRYEVMRYGLVPTEIKKQTGARYYQMTQEQYDRERTEAGTDDGILRAVPGGRAGGRITGSTRVG